MLMDLLMSRDVYEERLREAALERRARRVRQDRVPGWQRALTRLQAHAADHLIALGYRLRTKGELAYGDGVR